MAQLTATRAARLREIRRLKAQGLSSPQIGKRMKLAPSTVRDYLNDPDRARARKRQLRFAVEGVTMPAGGTEVTHVTASAKFTPHKGKGRSHNLARGRQYQAIVGWGARKGS